MASGAWWDPQTDRYRCAPAGCITRGLHPAMPREAALAGPCQVSVTQAAAADLGEVTTRWSARPYSVLLPTGYGCDAVELPALTARRVQALLAAYGLLGPVAVYPDGTALLFTAPSGCAAPDLEDGFAGLGALHHGRGSWIPLPPTQLAAGPIRWARSPSAARWRLPSSHTVARALQVADEPAAPAIRTSLRHGRGVTARPGRGYAT